MGIFYPSYIPKWGDSKPRRYPEEYKILKTNPHIKKARFKNKPDLQRHHISCDRSSDDARDIFVTDKTTHDQLHQQLIQLMSQLIKAGIVKFNNDCDDPYYYVNDIRLVWKLLVFRFFSRIRSRIKGKVKKWIDDL